MSSGCPGLPDIDCQVGLARYCDAMSSALVQTLIGGALAIIGGLVAAWWQVSRSDSVAKKIRRAERYEGALIKLNAQAAETVSQVCKVWGDTRSARLPDLTRRKPRPQSTTGCVSRSISCSIIGKLYHLWSFQTLQSWRPSRGCTGNRRSTSGVKAVWRTTASPP